MTGVVCLQVEKKKKKKKKKKGEDGHHGHQKVRCFHQTEMMKGVG